MSYTRACAIETGALAELFGVTTVTAADDDPAAFQIRIIEGIVYGRRFTNSAHLTDGNGETETDDPVAPDGTPKPYEAIAIAHNPGEGFEWRFELTADGITDVPTHDDSLTVCPGLRSGRYRFVYWGIPDAEADAVAVAFDLERTA